MRHRLGTIMVWVLVAGVTASLDSKIGASEWVVTERPSAEGGLLDVYATLAASDEDGTWTALSRPVVAVRCDLASGELHVYVLTRSAIPEGEPAATVGFDGAETVRVSMIRSESGDALFFPSATGAIQAIRDHDEMTFRTETTDARFVLEGAPESIDRVLEACSHDDDVVDAEPPPSQGPLMPGRDGVTNPVLIEESRKSPTYPRMARREHRNGKVILAATIGEDGLVGNLEVLKVEPEGYGFEKAAIDAVKTWRYKPAALDGKPVEVFLSIQVTFRLN